MKFFGFLVLTILLFSNAFAQNDQPAVVLQGFDAVSLVQQGKQIKGKPMIAVERGRFKYLFANQVNKQKFERNSKLYEVQKNGECAFMAGVPGDPDIWKVYQGKIYLFGTLMCRQRFRLSPETILHPEKQAKIKSRNVAIVLYEGVELLDFAGPGEVFAAAQTVDGQNGFNVYTVAETTEPIVSQGFVTVKPQYSFADAPKADIVIFPGGNVGNFLKNKTAMDWAKTAAKNAEIAMSVCTGVFVLADSKLLENKNVTTHWSSINKLRKQVPTATVTENVRFVDNGQVLTTAGVSAGIDGALHVVEKLLGTPSAKLTAKYMEYNWQPRKNSGKSK